MTLEVERDPVVVKAEQQVIDAVPEGLKPEVKAVEDEFNKVVDSAAEKAPEAEAQAAQQDPAVEQAAKDAQKVFSGEQLSPGVLVKDATAVVKEVKAGYKTTEFWLSAVVILLANVGALHLPGKYGPTIATAAAAGSYAISRGLAK